MGRETEIIAVPRPLAGAATLAWQAPELPVALLVGLLVVLLGLPRSPLLGDLDVGWLLRYGEMIWDTGRLPEADVFSFTRAGEKWTLYQWGFQAYLGGLHRLAGLGGVIWGVALIIGLTYALLLALVLQLGLNRLLSIGLVILAMATASHYWFARPGTCNFLFYLVALFILEDYRRRPQGQWWLLPPLFALWANVHLGFVVGLAAVLLYGLWAALDPRDFRGRGGNGDWTMLLVLPLCVAALCLNPYGLKIIPYTQKATSSLFLNDNILELQSPNFHNPLHLLFFAQIILPVWLGVGTFPGRSLFLALLSLTLFMALYSARHLTFYSLTVTVAAAQMLICGWGWRARKPAPPPWQGWGWGLVAVVLTLALVVGGQHWRPGHYDFNPKSVPQGAATFLQSQANSGPPLRVFSLDDQWASYLIYKLYPHIQVYLDTRYEFFGEDFIRETMKLQNQARQRPQVLNRYGVDIFLVKKDKSVSLPAGGPDWVLVYEDEQAALFRRRAGVSGRAGPSPPLPASE